MPKDLVAGGASAVTAVLAVAFLTRAGLPLPSNDTIENLFLYVLAPLAALGGYVAGRLVSDAKLSRVGVGGITVGAVVLGSVMSVIYVSNADTPLSPRMSFFITGEVGPFVLSIMAFYLVVSLAGFELASAGAGSAGQIVGCAAGKRKEDAPTQVGELKQSTGADPTKDRRPPGDDGSGAGGA